MSTYSTNLALELIGTGEQAGVWGTTTNTNLGTLIEQAISGYVTQAVATGTDTTITIPNGATGVARNMYIELTGTGGTNTNLIVPANKKLYFIFNNSTGAVTVKVSGQTGVSVPQGKKVVLTSNGTDIVNGLNYIADFGSNSATITQLTATSATITNLTLTSLVISNLSIASANITTLTATNETISGNLTLSGGTANGVLYLNGSKVATSGSALTFDGTTFANGAAWTTNPMASTQPQYFQYAAGTNFFQLAGDAGVGIRAVRFSNDASNPLIFLGKGRGTYASPAAVQTGDVAGNVRYDVYGGTNQRNIATILGGVETYTSDSNISGYLAFGTSPSGAANSSEKMRLTAAGDLGIGTASPTAKLHIYESSAAATRIRVLANGGQQAALQLAGNGTTFGTTSFDVFQDGGSDAYVANRANASLQFWTNNTERMRLTAAGDLGIGTASPGYKLDVRGVTASGNGTITTGFSYDTRGLVGTFSNHSLGFLTNGAVVGTWDTSGNLGLGVTPSAWGSGFKAIEGAYGQAFAYDLNVPTTRVVANAFNDGSWKYKISSFGAGRYDCASGAHQWFTAPSGTAGNAISFTQAMTLDASGDLMVGTTTKVPYSGNPGSTNFTLSGTSNPTSARPSITLKNSDDSARAWWVIDANNGAFIGTQTNNYFGFQTNNTERARITSGGNLLVGTTSDQSRRLQVSGTLGLVDAALNSIADLAISNTGLMTINPFCGTGSTIAFGTNASGGGVTERGRFTAGGYFKASNTGTYVGAAGTYHEFRQNGDDHVLYVSNSFATVTNNSLFIVTANRNTTNNTFYAMGYYNDAAAAFKLRVADSGDVTNTNGTYGTISDAKMKTDIVDAGSQWDDLKAVRFRKFKMKDDPSGLMQLGVVAQELEQTSPGLVDEHIDTEVIEVTDEEGNVTKKQRPTGTTTKSVKTSILLMKAAKALQEAMARIEKLEAEVAALKGA